MLTEFAVGTVAIISQIFESPICILMHKDYYFGIWREFFVWEIYIELFKRSISLLFSLALNIYIWYSISWSVLFWEFLFRVRILAWELNFAPCVNIDIWTFVIVTILITHFKISIYIKNVTVYIFLTCVILKIFVWGSYFGLED